jgi:ParB family transcriptional regulator, chromosome partitioning protein
MDISEVVLSTALAPLPPAATKIGAVEIEIRLLDRAYAHLRIREPPALARLMASLANDGQPSPVLVVEREAGRYVLIDGDDRIEALVRLGRETVTALVLGLTEPEALSYCYRMQGEGRRSALEEGWLVAELQEHGWAPSQISTVLGRSTSWVSRRLGLARLLPDKAADAVRRGVVPPHGAMKSLLPLARANKAHCERLCERLGGARVSSRQLDALYAAWRSGDAPLRERLLDSPLLFLKAKEAVTPPPLSGVTGVLVREIEAAREALSRAADTVVRAWSIDATALSSALVTAAVDRCTEAYEGLLRRLEEPDGG